MSNMPSAYSAQSRLRQFFIDNPDEELGFKDAAEKLGVPVRTVRAAVKELRAEGVIESVHVIRRAEKGRAR